MGDSVICSFSDSNRSIAQSSMEVELEEAKIISAQGYIHVSELGVWSWDKATLGDALELILASKLEDFSDACPLVYE
jgi:hypothetical protein